MLKFEVFKNEWSGFNLEVYICFSQQLLKRVGEETIARAVGCLCGNFTPLNKLLVLKTKTKKFRLVSNRIR